MSIVPGAPTLNEVVPYAQGLSAEIAAGPGARDKFYPQMILRSKIVGHLQYRWLTVGANLGVRIDPLAQGPEHSRPWDSLVREVPSQSWSNATNMVAISYSLGAQAEVFQFRQKADFFVFADLFGLSHVMDEQSSPLQRALGNPLELAIGGKVIVWKQLTFLLGMSVGLTQGYGAATVRPFLSASWTYTP